MTIFLPFDAFDSNYSNLLLRVFYAFYTMKTKHVLNLLNLLAEKENQHPDLRGFGEMSEAICKNYPTELITQRYLYDLYRKTEKKLEKGVETSSPRKYHIDIIAKHLGYPSFSRYEVYQETRISPNLKSCCGNWWSYVRANAGEILFKAPVKIYMDAVNTKVIMELRSNGRIFKGEVQEESGCMTSSLDSGSGKKLALVFKLGNSTSMEVLQGVFCGISSAGDPISGRELLIKEPVLAYEEMVWIQLGFKDEKTDPRILAYFSQYGQNCIKIKGVSSFNMMDLEALP